MTPEEIGKPLVAPDELLARFVLQRSHFRADGTVKPDTFIPHPYQDLSVTRHAGLSSEQVWEIGQGVAEQCRKTLYGRADLRTADYGKLGLQVVAAPAPENANHANVQTWPKEKPAQKLIAQQLAAAAGKLVWAT